MAYTLRLDKLLWFRDTRKANVRGPMMEEQRHRFDRFDGIALDNTNDWAVTVPGTSDSIATSETVGGSVLMTTGTADNDSCFLSSAIIYNGTKDVIIEWRITITDVTGTAVFVGLSDAKSEANGAIALQYPGDSFTSTADDVAGFVIDADHDSSLIVAASSKATSDTTPVSSGITWTDGQTKTLRLHIDTTGAATFYVDGDDVAHIDAAVTTDDLKTATVQAMTRAADGSNTVRVHSFDSWQDD